MILGVQTLRALAYGFGAVVLGTTLASAGLSDVEVGLVFTAMLLGMALASVAVARWSARIGRRRLYVALLGTMGASGSVFALTSWPPALILAALTGTMSTDANESGPITSLEQGMLADVSSDRGARVFGQYNAAAYLAGSIGALLAGGPAVLRKVVPALPSDQRWLLLFPVVSAAAVLLASRLPRCGTPSPDRRETSPPSVSSRSTVRRLSALFALDAFGGGLIVQSFIVFWFARRFGASTELMGVVLFAAGLLQAGSSLLAGRIAPRFGLVNTMVFTHLPSNLLLLGVAATPSLGAAVALLLCRFALSQMDVPARQALIAAVVDPSERTAAAAYTNAARYAARPLGPTLASALMERVALGAPFVGACAVKVVYDVLIFVGFRRAVPRSASGAWSGRETPPLT